MLYSYFIGYEMPWEEKDWEYPNNFASPLQIIIDASDGASDYGNKFGEPLISGINCLFYVHFYQKIIQHTRLYF